MLSKPQEGLVRIEVTISPKADDLLRHLMKASGYGTRGMVIQELIFAIHELIALDDKQTQSSEIRGILSTFTRFENSSN